MAVRDWAESEVIQLQNAGVLLVEDGNHGEYRPRRNEFSSVGSCFIRAADMDSGRVLFESAQRINAEALSRIRKGVGAGGDVLLSHKGTVGKVSYVPLNAPAFVCSPQTTFWRTLNETVLDRRYLYYFLCSKYFHNQLNSRKGETDMADYVSLTAQRRLRILLPPLPEQKAIAHILGTLDDKIELNRRMNETLEGMARTIFKSWFVDFDPVRAKMDGRPVHGLDPATAELFPDGFEHVAAGLLPSGWRLGSIRELCMKVENGGTPKRQVEEFWSPHDVPWLTSGEVRLGYIVSTENFISEVGLASSSAKLWPLFATVVALYGATAGFASLLGMELCANQACCALIPKANSACFNFLRVSSSMDHYSQQTRGSAQQNLSQTLVADLPTVVPPDAAMKVFEGRVRPLLARCIHNLRESQVLAALRDALLPKLLSGEIRVADAEKHVEAAIDGTESAPPSKPTETTAKIQASIAQVKTPTTSRAPSLKRQTPTLTSVDLDTDEVMCAFRQAARGQGELERERLLSLVARRLGYGRLGRNIRHTLKGHMRAAIRRRIIAANGQTACAETAAMSDYARDELVDTLRSVMRKNTEYARDEVIERVARHLGFARVRETVAVPIKSAINAGIRRGVLGGNQRMVWREE